MGKKQKPKLLLDWNNEPIVIKGPVEGNPCVAEYGAGPADKRCEECSHLVGIACSKTYYKCDQRQNTHSAKTDHRRRWPACARFEQRQGDMRLYDGR